MKTIALINVKGGSGKTTVALHLAVAASMSGRSVLVLDLDPQASASEWRDVRDAELPAVTSIQPARLERAVQTARDAKTDLLILDTAPHGEATALAAARAADLVLVPCRPSIMDLRAMRKTADLLRLAKANAVVVLNAATHHGAVADEAAEAITTDIGLPVAPVRLGQRVGYDRCLISGQAAQELEPAGKAAHEIEELYQWTCSQLSMFT